MFFWTIVWKKVLLIKIWKKIIKVLDLNNYKNLSKSNFNNYEIENQKLIENEIESNHKNLVNMKDEKNKF